ncbi:hypothetical protein [Flagellimonas sp.]|uniref:hypothetical protein n=1 Tax=Flagellimonas sp. TaxID=2058762 RepID=UPI003B502A27
MKLSIYISLVSTLFLMGCSQNQQVEKDLLIKNITIVDVESGKLISNKQVIIRDNIILAIENEVEDLSNYSVLEAEGKYLIPGDIVQMKQWIIPLALLFLAYYNFNCFVPKVLN